MKNGDLPAMPNLTANGVPTSERELHELLSDSRVTIGLTKREMFAMAAMQGIMANPAAEPVSDDHFKSIAVDAVKMADTLLAELELTK